VDRGDTVGAVRSHDSQVRHSDLFLQALLDQADAGDALLVSRIPAPDIVEKTAIDFEYDLQMPRQHLLEIVERPFFESFGQ
jgi:hypothetical protein